MLDALDAEPMPGAGSVVLTGNPDDMTRLAAPYPTVVVQTTALDEPATLT